MTELCELSSIDNGAEIIFATDDFFGIAENLLKESEPTEKGLMQITDRQLNVSADGWLTQRKRMLNHDFAIIKLAIRAEIHFICVDTTFMIGNVAPRFSVQANLLTTDFNSSYFQYRDNNLGTTSSLEEWSRIEQLQSETWPYLILPQTLNPGYESMKKYFHIMNNGEEYSHLRLNIFPDGGISRLRVYGKVILIPGRSLPQEGQIDLVSKIYGGTCIACSSCYNKTHPNNLIKPGDPTNEEDGWHTARSSMRFASFLNTFAGTEKVDKVFGEEWAVFQLGLRGKIASIIIDTEFCIGNAPYTVEVQGLAEENIHVDTLLNTTYNQFWKNIIFDTIVKAGTQQLIATHSQEQTKMTYVKLLIKPDGCVSRFRVLGTFQ